MPAQQPDAAAASNDSTDHSRAAPPAQEASARPPVYRQEQVFVSHAGPQKHFALHLRTQLQHAGVRTFVDERDLQPGEQHPASDVMKAACEQAQLVVFLVTRDFVRRPAAIQELRWAVAQRQEQLAKGVAADRALPQLLTVLYPTSACPSWRDTAELQQLLTANAGATVQLPDHAAGMVNAALADKPVDVGELQDGSLAALLRVYNADAEVQALADLATLAQPSVFRLDSVPRGDDLLIQSVRTAVLDILRAHMQLSMGQLVGLEPQLQQMRAALDMGSGPPGQDVRLHGLCGLGGIGKSTLAQRFFQEARSQFNRHAFLHVGQDVIPGPALISKQQELLRQIGGNASGSSDADLRDALRRSFQAGGPLLLILDDLWSEQQLAALLGCEPHSAVQLQAGQWAPGSCVLITARDKALVSGRLTGAAYPQPEPQQVQPLPELAAQQLLCLHAFEQGVQPPTFDEQQMAAATAICGGLPLTLRLLGGALQRCTTSTGWQAVLDNWASAAGPADDIALLAKSYEALPSDAHRRMFLDAALLLHCQESQQITTLWAAQLGLDDSLSGGSEVFRGSGWRSRSKGDEDIPNKMRRGREERQFGTAAQSLLETLVSASLITLDKEVSAGALPVARLVVHDRLRDMAHVIACDFGRPARWRLSDMAADDYLPEGLHFAADRLRCVRAVGGNQASLAAILQHHTALQAASISVDVPQAEYSSPALQHNMQLLYLRLHGAMPAWLGSLQQLAVLDVTAVQDCPWQCHELPDSISMLCNLRDLRISDHDFKQMLPWGIGMLTRLQRLNFKDCLLLRLPESIGGLCSLEQLTLDGCCLMQHLPRSLCQLKEGLQDIALQNCRSLAEIPAGFGCLTGLRNLVIRGCRRLHSLPSSIGDLCNLQVLDLACCSRLEQLPDSIGKLYSLQHLQLGGCRHLIGLPAALGLMSNLQFLSVAECSTLACLPAAISRLSRLRYLDIVECEQLQQLPDGVSVLTALSQLRVSGCYAEQQLPRSIASWSQIQAVNSGNSQLWSDVLSGFDDDEQLLQVRLQHRIQQEIDFLSIVSAAFQMTH